MNNDLEQQVSIMETSMEDLISFVEEAQAEKDRQTAEGGRGVSRVVQQARMDDARGDSGDSAGFATVGSFGWWSVRD